MRTHKANLDNIEPHFAQAVRQVYCMTKLNSGDVPAMAALQIRTGSENVIPRDADYYRNHFARGETAIGIVDNNGTLIAHALIRTDTDKRSTTMLNVLVDPQHRGHQLHAKMIKCWLEAAAEAGLRTALARVRVDNLASLKNFMAAGMFPGAPEPSPDAPQAMTYLMQKSLRAVTYSYSECRPS